MSKLKYWKISLLPLAIAISVAFQNCAPTDAFQLADLPSTSNAFSGGSTLDISQSIGMTCTNPNAITPTDSRRLSRLELINTYKSVFGNEIYALVEQTLMTLPNDDVKRDPKTFPAQYDQTQLELLDRASQLLANAVAVNSTHLRRVGGDCAAAATITADCVSNFITNFGKKMFRRPLKDEDKAFFQKIYADSGSGAVGIGSVVTAMALSPEFLFHIEIGNADSGADSIYMLSNYEIANRISYMLTDSPPDAELIGKVDNNTIREATVLSQQVERLLTSEAGKSKLRRFVHYWLLLDDFGLPNAANYLEGVNTSGLKDEMTREMMAFIDHIVFTKRGSYKDLLTSRLSFTQNAALNSIYGVSTENGQALNDEAHKGILLRSPVLANPTNNQTHPILRGTFTLRRILCSDIPSPTAADLADRINSPYMPNPLLDSTAVMTAKQTSEASCMTCHTAINPIGFAFEDYDNLGRKRTIDKIFDAQGNFIAKHDVKIDSRVNLISKTVQVSSGQQLVEEIANTAVGPACMTRHLFRFYQVRKEASTDSCAMSGTYQALSNPNGSILEGIKSTIMNTYTIQKRIQ